MIDDYKVVVATQKTERETYARRKNKEKDH